MNSLRDFNQVPLTLPMLRRVIERGEPFAVDEKLIDQVEIVGVATRFAEEGSMIELTLSCDGEEITVSTYRKDQFTVAPPFANYSYKPNCYTLVVGNINVFNMKVTINASMVQNIENLASLFLFKSKVLWNHLNRQKQIKKPEIVHNLDERFDQEIRNSNAFSDAQKIVIEAIRTCSRDFEGAKYNNIFNSVRAKLTDDQVKTIIDQLIQSAFIFVSEDNSYIIA